MKGRLITHISIQLCQLHKFIYDVKRSLRREEEKTNNLEVRNVNVNHRMHE